MIYRMACNLADALHDRKFPLRVCYGLDLVRPEHGGNASGVAVFERDRDGGDTVSGPVGAPVNPRLPAVRGLGVRVDLFARSSLAGARGNEHEALCDTFVDGLVSELVRWATEAKAGAIAYSEARYLRPDEESPARADALGVVYRLRFRVPRGVHVRTFEGEARPVGAFARVSTAVNVSRDGGASEPVPLGGD